MVVKGRAENDVDLRPLILSDLKRLCASQIHASPRCGGRCPTLLPLRLRKTSIRKRSRMSPHTATDDLNPSLKRLRVGVYGEQADAVIPHVVSVVVANTNGETKILSADYQVGFGCRWLLPNLLTKISIVQIGDVLHTLQPALIRSQIKTL